MEASDSRDQHPRNLNFGSAVHHPVPMTMQSPQSLPLDLLSYSISFSSSRSNVLIPCAFSCCGVLRLIHEPQAAILPNSSSSSGGREPWEGQSTNKPSPCPSGSLIPERLVLSGLEAEYDLFCKEIQSPVLKVCAPHQGLTGILGNPGSIDIFFKRWVSHKMQD